MLTYYNKNLIEGLGNQNCYLILTTTNNNTAQGRLWNRSTTSGHLSGIHLIEIDKNRTQSGTPCRMKQYERAPIGNNLKLAGNPLGMSLSNSSPMLGNPTSTKQPETGQKTTQSNTHRNSHEQ